MSNKLIKWAITTICSICIGVSAFLIADTTVFATCTAILTCGNGPSVSCSGNGSACQFGATSVSCDNGTIRTTCHCGSGCRDKVIGGGGGIEPEAPSEN